jgi:penicillin-insensitive murein endopeptidase
MRISRIAYLILLLPLILGLSFSAAEAKKHRKYKKHRVHKVHKKHKAHKKRRVRRRRKVHKRNRAKPKAARHSPIARKIFGRQLHPAPGPARAIGSYARGCLAGGEALPVTGKTWQHMRLSRNRNWGHPKLIKLVERLANESHEKDGWSGLLVGDLTQPMGGPMLSGHASHQIGLDVDIWLNPMPDRVLTKRERENISAVSMLDKARVAVDPAKWTEGHFKLLKRAASYKQVTRVFVHPAIKKALCDTAEKDRGWLEKVRPYWGHHYHFHIRMRCPSNSKNCENQPAPPSGDGCGKELTQWLARVKPPTHPVPKKKKSAPKHNTTLAKLPRECAKLVGVNPYEKGPVLADVVPLPTRRPVPGNSGKN